MGLVPENGIAALGALRRWADPRERELRKRRRMRQRGIRHGTIAGAVVVGDIGLAAASAPLWMVAVVGAWSGVLGVSAALTARRYLDLRDKPLPVGVFRSHALPPIGSVARGPMTRLERAQRAMHELRPAIERTGLLEDEDLREAEAGAAELQALAGHIVAMERAAGVIGRDTTDVTAARTRLEDGVTEYESMVAAAIRVVGLSGTQRHPELSPLRSASDRFVGLASALRDIHPDRHPGKP